MLKRRMLSPPVCFIREIFLNAELKSTNSILMVGAVAFKTCEDGVDGVGDDIYQQLCT